MAESMVGGATARRVVMQREFLRALVLNLSDDHAVLTHRPGELSLDKNFLLIEGHPE